MVVLLYLRRASVILWFSLGGEFKCFRVLLETGSISLTCVVERMEVLQHFDAN